MTAEEAIAIITGAQTMVINRDPDKFVAAIDRALISLRLERQRDNPKPLTIEELRQMNGEPVWVKPLNAAKDKGEWCVTDFYKDSFDALIPGIDNTWYESKDYGKTWEAYRHKPKEATEE